MLPIPVFFIDANRAFRRLVVHVLTQYFRADIELLADGDTWPIPSAASAAPEAVLLGLGSEGLINPQLFAAIHAALPGVPIMVLGHLDDRAYRDAALATGAAAFLAKDMLCTELVPVLRRITRAHTLCQEVAPRDHIDRFELSDLRTR